MLRSKQRCEGFSIGDKKLENDEGVEKLFFELASESRLSILRELQIENLKMQEIARRLDVTATEAFRQLQQNAFCAEFGDFLFYSFFLKIEAFQAHAPTRFCCAKHS